MMRVMQLAAACGVVVSTAAAAHAQGIDWDKIDATFARKAAVAGEIREHTKAVASVLGGTSIAKLQDAYPGLFLKVQHHFDTHLGSLMTAVGNIGAIFGGLFFGSVSEKIGRRRAIMIAALIALPALPFWAFGSTPLILAAGAFLMQISVQGAWGVIPVHLNELSPPEIRATFPGFVYQLGNLLAAVNLNLQVAIAEAHGNDYGLAMAIVVGTVAVVITLMVAFGPERLGIPMNAGQGRNPPDPRDPGRAAATG